MSFYSENGVDKFVSPFLPEFGYGCDVGANNGLFKSNTKHFEDKGWMVLCIEPNPLLSEEGRKNRKLWRAVACGSSAKPNAPFVVVGDYPFASYSGFHTDNIPASDHTKGGRHDGLVFPVEVQTLDSLLDEAGFPRLDLLNIDTEGDELEVLQGIDLRRWKPKIIVAESWTQESQQKIATRLAEFGYALLGVKETDYCYGKD